MFGVGVSMEEFPCAFIIGKISLFMRLFIFPYAHAKFLFWWWSMKINFQMLVFWPSRSLGFQGPTLKLNVFLTLLVC
jgi:hypothetical protein